MLLRENSVDRAELPEIISEFGQCEIAIGRTVAFRHAKRLWTQFEIQNSNQESNTESQSSASIGHRHRHWVAGDLRNRMWCRTGFRVRTITGDVSLGEESIST